MLKVLRESAIENPWFYRIIMLMIAIAFVITMGWGFGTSKSNKKDYVAKVNGEPITTEEFQDSYRTTVAFYKSMMKDKFNEDTLKQMNLKKNVVNSLIEKKLWQMAAKEMGITISDEEVRSLLKNNELFQKNKVFDEATYRQVLAYNHLKPALFEESQRKELLYEKIRSTIRDSVTLSPLEEAVNSTSPEEIERVTKDKLNQKREKAVQSFLVNLKAKAEIEIKNEHLEG
ncbi:MAG: SurA N-terminal domain-containing protein [Nitrospirae bacterium]|nr:SurA N-terminal domain-containing protein [Nitrospirota bacterium]MBI3353014.1 SurA N-terminal domain-containing protein [Nitrospirota bacterium]